MSKIKFMRYHLDTYAIVGEYKIKIAARPGVKHEHKVIFNSDGRVRCIFRASDRKFFSGWLPCACHEEDVAYNMDN